MTIRTKKYVAVVAVFFIVAIFGLLISLNGARPQTAYVSGQLVERNTDDLFAKSSLIVTGTVTGKSDAFQIRHISGAVTNFTDYYLKVSSTLRGKPTEDIVTIRVQGGTVHRYTEIYEHSPSLKDNQEYLLFLYKPSRGGAYNTDGDYYYVLGLTQGTFSKSENGDYISAVGVNLTPRQIEQHLKDAPPIDELYFRNEYITNQKRNLENDFITQEEYDYLMKNIDTYATIIK